MLLLSLSIKYIEKHNPKKALAQIPKPMFVKLCACPIIHTRILHKYTHACVCVYMCVFALRSTSGLLFLTYCAIGNLCV